MPKHNPKLNKKDDKKKKRRSRYIDGEPYEFEKDYTKSIMSFLVIVIIGVIIFLVVVVYDEEAPRVEQYDLVKLNYEIYSLEDYNENRPPTIQETNYWVNACHRYDSSCECHGNNSQLLYECNYSLIKGFYNELMGRKEGDKVNSKYIDACIDKDKDGFDDFSGEEALSYGFPNDTLYNTEIVLKFEILRLQKRVPASSNPSFTTSQIFEYVPFRKKWKD